MKKPKRSRPLTGGNSAYAAGAQALRFSNAAGIHRQKRARSEAKREAIRESRSL